MPIDGDFSFQVEQNPVGGQDKPAPTRLFAFDQCQEYLMPNGSYLVRNPRNGKHAMLTADVLGAMNDCSVFRTLNGHVEHVLESNPSMRGHEADIKSVLQSVQDDGLTISAATICAGLGKNSTARVLNDIPVAVITTWERPDALQRLLQSIEQNWKNKDDSVCYVVDDTRDEKNRLRNQSITESFKANGWANLVYLGHHELLAILNEIINRLPEHEEAIRFCLDREKWADLHSCGLSRNYGLFVAAGRRVVFFDDDAICVAHEPVKPRKAVKLGNEQREADFFDDITDNDQFDFNAKLDVIEQHSLGLGMNLGDALGVLGTEAVAEQSLKGTRPGTIEGMSSSSPVFVTCSGWFGDPGSASNRWIGKVTKTTRQRLLTSDKKLETALTKRQAWLGREHYQVQPQFNMSPVCGVDNRVCLPPYFPVFRGQDAWFGKMVEMIYPESVCLEFPWVVKHIPSENRRWDIADTDFYLEELFPMFFEYYLDWQKKLCSVEGPRNRTVFLANAVRDLANRSSESLLELHKDSSVGMQTKHMQKLIDVLADSKEAPELWRKLLEEAIAKASSDILQVMSEVSPEAFPNHLEFDELISFWRAAWSDCAAAIEAWEEIRLVAPVVIRDQGLAV